MRLFGLRVVCLFFRLCRRDVIRKELSESKVDRLLQSSLSGPEAARKTAALCQIYKDVAADYLTAKVHRSRGQRGRRRTHMRKSRCASSIATLRFQTSVSGTLAGEFSPRTDRLAAAFKQPAASPAVKSQWGLDSDKVWRIFEFRKSLGTARQIKGDCGRNGTDESRRIKMV